MKKINWQYALGEIVIVIIGITVAFALNNWKDTRNNQKIKTQYLSSLKTDIQKEIKQLEELQQLFRQKMRLISQVMQTLNNKDASRDSTLLRIYEIARLKSFIPENTTYQTLINSGDMKLINDLNLRHKIEEHYALHQVVMKDYTRLEKIYNKYLGDYFIFEMDYEKIRQKDWSFLDKPLLKNILRSINGSYYMTINTNKKCIASNQNLLKALQ
ncbi:hypothetical protein BKI52_42280 [marine bacterium AO1-C]|nr:hypothetical protein BKI52_42280 [marine bacterium AO1-C]